MSNGNTSDISYPLVLTIHDIIDIMQIGRSKAYELVHSDGFPLKKIGRKLRIPRDPFFYWLNSTESKSFVEKYITAYICYKIDI